MTTSADTAHETPEAGSPAQPRTAGGRQVAALAVAGVLIGAAAVVGLLAGLRSAGTTAPAERPSASTAGVEAASAPPPSRAATAPAGGWTVTRTRSGRVPVVTLELLAGNEIGLMDRRSRPVLVLRCSTVLEAFVVTGGAAAIEKADHLHTVAVGFDGAAPAPEKWLDSEERDALFAPDPAAFARRLASAGTMRFEFVPFGAPRAAAEFNVTGLDAVTSKMTIPKACAW